MPALLPLLTLTVPAPIVAAPPPETQVLPLVTAAVAVPALDDDVPEMEYTYAELNYLWTDSDDLDEELGGVELTGSLELPLNFFGQVAWTNQSDDSDVETLRIGAGWHFGLGTRLDAYGMLSYLDAEVEDDDEDGIAGELGVRWLMSPNFEVNAAAKWADVEEDDYGIAAGARYYLIDILSVGGRVESFDDDLTFAVGVRVEI
jgi:hypothetical protein